MQTLVGYAFERRVEPEHVARCVERVESRYAPLWGSDDARHDAVAGSTGLFLWGGTDSRWPAWVHEGDDFVATLHVPLGWASLVGDLPPEQAPVPLARYLSKAPSDVCELTPPFVLAHLDQAADRLTLHTDMLGVGRLFEVRCADGWVWSNRPAAALAFAGMPARASGEGWRYIAACDWAMGDTTAYAGVRAVGPATQIWTDGASTRRTSLDILSDLCTPAGEGNALCADGIERTADALVRTARALASVWTGRPELGLSGGRDSRLVVASFVAAGVDISLYTDGAVEGEAVTATALVDALPDAPPHTIRRDGGPRSRSGEQSRPGAISRARRWHDQTEGMHPASSLAKVPPKTPAAPKGLLVSGSAGEVAHGYYYTGDFRRISRLPRAQRLDGYLSVVTARAMLPHGLARSTREQVEAQVRAVLGAAIDAGADSPIALDWFYVAERLRRWGLSGASSNKVLPLLTPEFVRAAFRQSPRQRKETALHSALIARLVPRWAEIPFFNATLAQREKASRRRLCDDPDRDLVTGLLVRPDEWAEAFDLPAVVEAWRRSASGESGQRDEQLVQRVVWRAAFDDHVAALNGHEPARTGTEPSRRPLATGAGGARPLARRTARCDVGERPAGRPVGRAHPRRPLPAPPPRRVKGAPPRRDGWACARGSRFLLHLVGTGGRRSPRGRAMPRVSAPRPDVATEDRAISGGGPTRGRYRGAVHPRSIPLDTDPEVWDVLVARWRTMTIAERITLVDRMRADVTALALAGIRAAHPSLTEQEVLHELARRRFGSLLADEAYGRSDG